MTNWKIIFGKRSLNATILYQMNQAPPGPLLLTRKDLIAVLRSPRLVDGIIRAGWLCAVRHGARGRGALYTAESVRRAYERLAAGEMPLPPP